MCLLYLIRTNVYAIACEEILAFLALLAASSFSAPWSMIKPKAWRAMIMALGSSGWDGCGREAGSGVSGWSEGAAGTFELLEEM